MSNQPANQPVGIFVLDDAERTKYHLSSSVVRISSGRKVPRRLNRQVRPFHPTSSGRLGIQSYKCDVRPLYEHMPPAGQAGSTYFRRLVRLK